MAWRAPVHSRTPWAPPSTRSMRERGVGRVVLARDDGRITLDISALRGPDLLTDLTARDFTV